jgi:hypothetical protein
MVRILMQGLLVIKMKRSLETKILCNLTYQILLRCHLANLLLSGPWIIDLMVAVKVLQGKLNRAT